MNGMNFANVLLSVRPDGTYEPFSAEAWQYVGQMMLLGMGMVFAVLGVLWGILVLFKLIFARTPKKKQKENKETVSAEAPAVVPATNREDDLALIAVLTAAVAAYREAEGETTDGFRVVSFRRTDSGRSWNAKR